MGDRASERQEQGEIFDEKARIQRSKKGRGWERERERGEKRR